MKNFKLFSGLFVAAMFAMCVTSCGNKAKSTAATTDSTKVDSTNVDSTKVDSAAVAGCVIDSDAVVGAPVKK